MKADKFYILGIIDRHATYNDILGKKAEYKYTDTDDYREIDIYHGS